MSRLRDFFLSVWRI